MTTGIDDNATGMIMLVPNLECYHGIDNNPKLRAHYHATTH